MCPFFGRHYVVEMSLLTYVFIQLNPYPIDNYKKIDVTYMYEGSEVTVIRYYDIDNLDWWMEWLI